MRVKCILSWLKKITIFAIGFYFNSIFSDVIVTSSTNFHFLRHSNYESNSSLKFETSSVGLDSFQSLNFNLTLNPLTCATCPDSDDGQNCFTESITRTTRKPGGGFDRCSDKFYSGVYSATNRIRNSTSPWLSEDSFRDLADWLVDWQGNCNFEPEKVRCGDIVWVYSGWEEKFFVQENFTGIWRAVVSV